MPEEEHKIGLGLREAKQELITLTKRIEEVSKKLSDARIKNLMGTESTEYKKLYAELETLEQQTNQVREWYNIGLSERLYDESKRLNTLTKVLIGFTAVLAVLTIIDILSKVL